QDAVHRFMEALPCFGLTDFLALGPALSPGWTRHGFFLCAGSIPLGQRRWVPGPWTPMVTPMIMLDGGLEEAGSKLSGRQIDWTPWTATASAARRRSRRPVRALHLHDHRFDHGRPPLATTRLSDDKTISAPGQGALGPVRWR